jgi:hypothetical protein
MFSLIVFGENMGKIITSVPDVYIYNSTLCRSALLTKKKFTDMDPRFQRRRSRHGHEEETEATGSASRYEIQGGLPGAIQ